MRETLEKSRETLEKLREKHGRFPEFANGGYPLYYLDAAQLILCAKCANEEDDFTDLTVAVDINWEDRDLWCDHCSERIPSAYAEDD